MAPRVIAIVMLLLSLSCPALADSPMMPENWFRHHGDYLFVMLAPHSEGMVSSNGETYRVSGLYRYPGPPEPLWTVGFYALDSEVFLTDDGRYMARLGPWPMLGNYQELAVAFYEDGYLVRQYTVSDLVKEPEEVRVSASHYTWRDYSRFDRSEGRLTVATLEGTVYGFDIQTGEIVGPAPAEPEAKGLPWTWLAVGGSILLLAAGLLWRLFKTR